METRVHPPETLEGWYVLHQLFAVDRSAADPEGHTGVSDEMRAELDPLRTPADGGWSAMVELIGSTADLMLIHVRPTLDAIGDAQRSVARLHALRRMSPVHSFLSVTEAGLYHLTAQLARAAAERGGAVGDEAYAAALAERGAAERENPQVRRRLYPEVPSWMPYVCFYPMSKRREAGQNWYTLTLEERSRLMYAHGQTGRRYAGRVVQVISGAIGLDAWEWGVTLFARDPLEFKKLVTEMRFDEVSAKYAEFGRFYVGRLVE